jgi:hypothetical protein
LSLELDFFHKQQIIVISTCFFVLNNNEIQKTKQHIHHVKKPYNQDHRLAYSYITKQLTHEQLTTPTHSNYLLTKHPHSKTWAITVTLSLHLPNAAGAIELATGHLWLVGAATTALRKLDGDMVSTGKDIKGVYWRL